EYRHGRSLTGPPTTLRSFEPDWPAVWKSVNDFEQGFISLGKFMELTKDERKILDDAAEVRLKMASRRRWLLTVVVIGIIGAEMMIVEGLKTLASGKEGYPQIAFAFLLAGFLVECYESVRFRAVSFSLIWKLKNEQDSPQLT